MLAGWRFVAEMNDFGIFVDVLYCGEVIGLGAMEVSLTFVVVMHLFCHVLLLHICAKFDDFLCVLVA